MAWQTRNEIARVLRKGGPMTVLEIAEELGLSDRPNLIGECLRRGEHRMFQRYGKVMATSRTDGSPIRRGRRAVLWELLDNRTADSA